jgi:hypothetical protein
MRTSIGLLGSRDWERIAGFLAHQRAVHAPGGASALWGTRFSQTERGSAASVGRYGRVRPRRATLRDGTPASASPVTLGSTAPRAKKKPRPRSLTSCKSPNTCISQSRHRRSSPRRRRYSATRAIPGGSARPRRRRRSRPLQAVAGVEAIAPRARAERSRPDGSERPVWTASSAGGP